MVLLLLNVDSLFNVPPIVCEGSGFGPCFVMHYLASILVLQYHLDEEERAGYFTLIIFLESCGYFLWIFLTVPWVGLQCMIVVFPEHTHFFHTFMNV